MSNLTSKADAVQTAQLYFDRSAVAGMLSISPRTLDRLISTGKFPAPAMALSQKLKRWSIDQIRNWTPPDANNGQ